LESGYGSLSRTSEKTQQREEKREQQAHRREEPGAALIQAMTLLQAGARLRDLSPEQAREVAAVLGNQTVLQLLHGGSAVKLAPAPPGGRTEEALPVTAVDIRWPALAVPPGLNRDGRPPGGVFDPEHLREMGRYGAEEVPPDG